MMDGKFPERMPHTKTQVMIKRELKKRKRRMNEMNDDDLFDSLYKDLLDECDGASMMFVNDRSGYDKWYRERMKRLCIEFKYKEKANNIDNISFNNDDKRFNSLFKSFIIDCYNKHFNDIVRGVARDDNWYRERIKKLCMDFKYEVTLAVSWEEVI